MVTDVPTRLNGNGTVEAAAVDVARFVPKIEIMEPAATPPPGASGRRKLAPFKIPPAPIAGWAETIADKQISMNPTSAVLRDMVSFSFAFGGATSYLAV